MSIICFGLNHKTAPLPIRERFTLIEAQIPAALRALSDLPSVTESVIVSTCNRTEIYIYSQDAFTARNQLYSYLFLIHKITAKQISKYFYLLTDIRAAEHLFSVASGLDSLVIGEGQILGQIRRAFTYAKHSNTTKSILNKLFTHAIKTGKRARSETKIAQGASSVSFAAVELVKKKFREPSSVKIIVIGTGKMGKQAVKLLRQSGAHKIYLTNRSHDKALQFAKDCGGEAVRFENLQSVLRDIDIIISSTTSPHFILTKDQMKDICAQRHYRPLFIIDIAVPRDIDPQVRKIKNTTLYNIDDLEEIVDATMQDRVCEVEKVKKIIEEEIASFDKFMKVQKVAPLIRTVEEKYSHTLDELIKTAPAEKQEEYKLFGKKLIGRLLHGTIINIKEFASDENFAKNIDYLKQIF